MCLSNKRSLPENNIEIDLYKVFEIAENGKLRSIYRYDEDDKDESTFVFYNEKEWIKAHGIDYGAYSIEGFHAFVSVYAAQAWGRRHVSFDGSPTFTIRKVRFRNLIAEGTVEIIINGKNNTLAAYTAMEMYIHPEEVK
jgi:hypothetical protein